MPQKTQDNMKGTSPSKLINQGIERSWGQQGKPSTTAQEAISKQWNKQPLPPGDTKKSQYSMYSMGNTVRMWVRESVDKKNLQYPLKLNNQYVFLLLRRKEDTVQISRRAISAKEKGRKGGQATARNHDADFLELRASKAGSSTRDKYGIGYYRYLRTLRGKPKTPKEKIIESIVPGIAKIPETSTELMIAASKNLL